MDVYTEKFRPTTLDEVRGQDENIQIFKHFLETKNIPNLLLYGPKGSGKCHAIDTPILMYDGSIKMVQDILVGEQLMGDDSKPRNVLSLGTGKDTMYTIKPTKGESLTVNSEHILCLNVINSSIIYDKSRQKFKVTYFKKETNKLSCKRFKTKQEAQTFRKLIPKNQIIEISVKDYLKLSKSVQKFLRLYRVGVDFKTKKVPVDPYIIGLWLGDGRPFITNQESAVVRDTLPKYNLRLNYHYGISGNKMLKTLQEHDMINNKHIPDVYKINSREVRLQVLAGIIDSDGHLDSRTKAVYEITQTHETLIDDIIYLARSLGFAAYKTSWTYKGNSTTFRVHISGNVSEIPCKINRKIASKRLHNKDVLITNFNVLEKDIDNYYGFTLDGNHRYLMGNFIVSHNTSTILAFCRDLYGKDYKKYILELNASHDRGINDVRKKIKHLAKMKMDNTVPYKIIILDEADSMTKDAMFALRMIMEDYSKITKFCLICNYPYKIIPPIISRCISMYFHPIASDVIYDSLTKISNTTDEDSSLRKIISHSNGDMRKSLLLYQYDISDSEHTITDEHIHTLWSEMKTGKFDFIYSIYNQCYKPIVVLERLLAHIMSDTKISDSIKVSIISFISNSSKNILNGSNLYIQYVNMCTNIVNTLKSIE
jgi:DNA polymerase III delta prime subunit